MGAETEPEAMAARVADLVVEGTVSEGLAESLAAAYAEACREAPAIGDTAPSTIGADAIRYMQFEFICYAASCVLVQLPKRLRRRRLLILTEPDVGKAARFAAAMLDRLQGHIQALGLADLREREVVALRPHMRVHESDQTVQLRDRVSTYWKAHNASGTVLKTLGLYVGVGAFPASYPLVSELAWEYATPVLKFTAEVVESAFWGRGGPPRA